MLEKVEIVFEPGILGYSSPKPQQGKVRVGGGSGGFCSKVHKGVWVPGRLNRLSESRLESEMKRRRKCKRTAGSFVRAEPSSGGHSRDEPSARHGGWLSGLVQSRSQLAVWLVVFSGDSRVS